MLKIMMVFMMVFLGLEAVPLPILKTGQIQSYDALGVVVTDDSIKDDGYYQTGARRRYTRDDSTEIVTDEVTGLEWQDDASVETNVLEWTEADRYCSTLDVNGERGWRLPSNEELESIVDRGRFYQAINEAFINISPNISLSYYWSSTSLSYDVSSSAWYVNFRYGHSRNDHKGSSLYVRCVRGEQFDNLNFSRDNVAEIVTDSVTNLQWQDNDVNTTQNWTGAIEYCEALDMAGQTDWRLPNQNELLSIVDRSKSVPAINDTFTNTFFPTGYWSSTSDAGNTSYAWIANFDSGGTYYGDKTNKNYVRCVRGGQLDNLKLKSLTKTGQTKSYDVSGSEVTDDSIKDDGYYQAGFKRSYTRNDAIEVVIDNTTKLQWQDDSIVETNNWNWVDANSYCSSLNLNNVEGWRLPSKEELESLIDRGGDNATIDDAFINASPLYYWSSTTAVSYPLDAWYVDFSNGSFSHYNKYYSRYVRCVRGGQFDNLNFSRNDTTEIVRASVTNLQWQDDMHVKLYKKQWVYAIEYCEELTLAGQTDWRLPNQNELLSIVNNSRYDPAINEVFNNFSTTGYWSSTTYADNTINAEYVNFRSGDLSDTHKSTNLYVRCVRGGELQNKTIMAPIIMYLLN